MRVWNEKRVAWCVDKNQQIAIMSSQTKTEKIPLFKTMTESVSLHELRSTVANARTISIVMSRLGFHKPFSHTSRTTWKTVEQNIRTCCIALRLNTVLSCLWEIEKEFLNIWLKISLFVKYPAVPTTYCTQHIRRQHWRFLCDTQRRPCIDSVFALT